MVRAGFKFALPDDGGVQLSKMLLDSPNPQFNMTGDMLQMFEEMQSYADGFTDCFVFLFSVCAMPRLWKMTSSPAVVVGLRPT